MPTYAVSRSICTFDARLERHDQQQGWIAVHSPEQRNFADGQKAHRLIESPRRSVALFYRTLSISLIWRTRSGLSKRPEMVKTTKNPPHDHSLPYHQKCVRPGMLCGGLLPMVFNKGCCISLQPLKNKESSCMVETQHTDASSVSASSPMFQSPHSWSRQFTFHEKHLFYNRIAFNNCAERAVEIPVAFDFLARQADKEPILEVGNVLQHSASVSGSS
jgi:hypothetical protein